MIKLNAFKFDNFNINTSTVFKLFLLTYYMCLNYLITNEDSAF